MKHKTKSGDIERNEKEDREKEIEQARREYFQTNPETKPYANTIRFYVNGKTVSIDDSKLPKDIANIVRKRDGRKML